MNHICYDEYEVDSRYLEAGVTVQFGGVVFLDAIDLVFDLFVGCWPLHAWIGCGFSGHVYSGCLRCCSLGLYVLCLLYCLNHWWNVIYIIFLGGLHLCRWPWASFAFLVMSTPPPRVGRCSIIRKVTAFYVFFSLASWTPSTGDLGNVAACITSEEGVAFVRCICTA